MMEFSPVVLFCLLKARGGETYFNVVRNNDVLSFGALVIVKGQYPHFVTQYIHKITSLNNKSHEKIVGENCF